MDLKESASFRPMSVSQQLLPSPSPNPLTFCELTLVGLGEEWVCSCSVTDIDLRSQNDCCNLQFHFTGSVHFLMTLVNSDITISTHFTAGLLSLSICRFTIASKAISGVKRPTLS